MTQVLKKKEMGYHRNGIHREEYKREEEGKKNRRYRLVPKFGCVRSDDDVSVAERPDVDGSFNVEAGVDVKDHLPTHLIVMVNGIIGSARNWRYAAKQFVKAYPDDIVVHCSEANSSMLTFHGVDVMGRRLADEVISVVSRHQNLKKISFVAHSFGGLVSRYAAACLYQQVCMEEFGIQNGDCRSESEEDVLKGKIAGLEPVNFITFATPHLGSRGRKQVPLFCGVHYIEEVACRVSWFLGRTGKHLFLSDCENGKPPLLLQMSKDSDDLKFISCLESFKRRVAYANTHCDHLVAWSSASLRLHHEHPKRQNLSKNTKYPHIVNEDEAKKVYHQEVISLEAKVARSKTVEMEEAMIRGLTRLLWERVDVDFSGNIRSFLAHSNIQVKNYCINFEGADVIQHMIDSFHL